MIAELNRIHGMPLTLLAVVAIGTPKDDDSDEYRPGLTPCIQPCPATWGEGGNQNSNETFGTQAGNSIDIFPLFPPFGHFFELAVYTYVCPFQEYLFGAFSDPFISY